MFPTSSRPADLLRVLPRAVRAYARVLAARRRTAAIAEHGTPEAAATAALDVGSAA